jgi:hypothetical protein
MSVPIIWSFDQNLHCHTYHRRICDFRVLQKYSFNFSGCHLETLDLD